MADVINLLPDSIASQIAAGEVIQRPASVVKELIENSVDAGADNITLIIKDAGKTLIQVVDNGVGMSETDARMCFERHATSKIKNANDIFSINTKGFRGEALASIAAIAHVELITKQDSDEVGTKVFIMGSKVTKQEMVQSETGTKISVKNLFFNVPARRKFLKSDVVELKHITDEFLRIALAHTDIAFSFYNNGKEIYRLPKSNLKQRIVSLFGRGFDTKLLHIKEQTEFLDIEGYVGKIEAARKSRSHQYIFVNNRFIKSNYLSHAIKTAYADYLSEDLNPVYFLYLKTDPANIDVNIHPTKQEIKFEDEKLIYNYIRVAVKRVIAKFGQAPTLGFEVEGDPEMNNFLNKSRLENTNNKISGNFQTEKRKKDTEWERAFDILKDKDIEGSGFSQSGIPSKLNKIEKSFSIEENKNYEVLQLNKSFIVKPVESGLMIIDQYYAHERVLYEKYLNSFEMKSVRIKQLLFPIEINIRKDRMEIIKSLLDELKTYGFMIELKGEQKLIVKGVPVELGDNTAVDKILESIIDDVIENKDIEFVFKENLAKILARSNAKKHGFIMSKEEMEYLIDRLFECENPYKSPNGKKTYIVIETNDIQKRF